MKFEKIIWQGEEYVLCSEPEDYEGEDKNGPIATTEQFNSAIVGPAHLFEDGRVMAYGKEVGKREDITFTGVWVEVDPDVGAHVSGFLDSL